MNAPIQRRRLSRRSFLAIAGGSTVAVAVGAGYALTDVPNPLSGQVINAFVSLLPDGDVQIVCPAQDLGQGAPLALAMTLAEEMGANLARVAIIPAPRDVGTYGNPDFGGHMVTADSKTTRGYYRLLRLAGAEARRALIETVCARRGWRAEDCRAEAHTVIHDPTGDSVGFEEIAAWGELRTPGAGALKDEAEFSLIGESPEDPALRDIVMGAKRFGVDHRAPDMAVAVLARSPHLGGAPVRVDDRAALSVPGVEAVVPLEDAVAVVATTTWAALKGRAALTIDWTPPAAFDSAEEAAALATALDASDSPRVMLRATEGDGPAPAARLEMRFHAPRLTHVVMEPINASARGESAGLGVAIAGSTQALDLDMRYGAKTWKTAPFMVETIGRPSGGAYGRRVLNDAVRDAAAVAAAVGRPVQVIRPMLDELRRGQTRPAAVQRLAIDLAEDGAVAGWRHDIASDGTLATHLPSSLKGENGDEDNTATDGARHGYALPNQRIAWTRVAAAPVPGFLRGVSAGYTVWAIETAVERVARRAGDDPLAWRLRHLEEPRQRAVLETAAAMAGWGAAGRHLGLGTMEFRGSYVATVAEIVDRRVAGLWIAVDVGRPIHADNTRAQVEGGVLWGLSMALTERLGFEDGRAAIDSLADYPMLALSDVPPIEIHLADPVPGADPGGAGEIGVPTTIAAIANAMERATGREFDRLPLSI